MIPDIPWYITLAVVVASLAAAAGAWRILASAADRSGLPADTARKVRLGSAIVLFGWLAAALLLAPAPASLAGRDPYYLTPLFPLFGLGSAGVVLAAVLLSPALRRTLAAASLPAVHGVQLYRLVGALFIVLLAQGRLPAHFALPAGWGDVAVGLAAPLVALALARRAAGSRAFAAGWNVFGLLDLVVAVGMGTGYLASKPPAAAMGAFPLVLVPTFAVPLSVMLHVLGLARLAGAGQPSGELRPSAAR